MFPLEDQVWTGVNEQRRLALEANGGDLVSPRIFPATATAYLRPDGIRFTSVFPWITLPARPAANYLGSFLDQSYRTGSITAFMPLLLLLSVWGCITTYRPKGWRGAATMRIPLLAHAGDPRGDPLLRLHRVPLHLRGGPRARARRRGRVHRPGPTARRRGHLGGDEWPSPPWASSPSTASSRTSPSRYYTNRINNPHELRDYARLQEEISDRTPGRPFDDLVYASARLPATGQADEYQIVGDCDALYVGTGEPLWPWMPVQLRELGWDLDLAALPEGGPDEPIEITLATPAGLPRRGRRAAHRGRHLPRHLRHDQGGARAPGPARSRRTGCSVFAW